LLRKLRFAPNYGSTTMGSKVQGEGDYESARRYNDETRQFVADHTKGGKEIKGSAAEASDELTPAEQEAVSHAKSGAEDKRDAKMLSDMEKKHQR
jgi:hypothetical protein